MLGGFFCTIFLSFIRPRVSIRQSGGNRLILFHFWCLNWDVILISTPLSFLALIGFFHLAALLECASLESVRFAIFGSSERFAGDVSLWKQSWSQWGGKIDHALIWDKRNRGYLSLLWRLFTFNKFYQRYGVRINCFVEFTNLNAQRNELKQIAKQRSWFELPFAHYCKSKFNIFIFFIILSLIISWK